MHRTDILRHMYQFAPLLRYAATVLLVGLALFLTWWIPPLHQTPFPLFFAAVMVAAAYAGRGPGTFAVFLSSAVLAWFLLAPVGSLSLGLPQAIQLNVFILVALWINSVHEHRRQVEKILRDEAARLILRNEGLEQHVSQHSQRKIGLIQRLLVTALAMMGVMFVFEFTKQSVLPGVTLWQSHSITILFSGTLATGVAFFVLRQQATSDLALLQAALLHHSKRELADFFQNAPVGLYWVSADGVILNANQAELDLLGYSREEYVGRPIADFHVDADVISDILRLLQAGEVIHDCEARLRCKDGSIKTVLIDSNVWWENGKFLHARCFTCDISDRKKLEDQVRRTYGRLDQRVQERTAELSQANEDLRGEFAIRRQTEATNRQLAAIVESSADAIVSKTLDGGITSWNAGAERLYGYTVDECLGKGISMLIPPDRRDDHSQIMETIRRGEAVPSFETVRLRKDGTRVDVSVALSPIKGATGDIVGASVITRDIGQQKRMERRRTARLAVTEVVAQADSMGEATPRILQAICESLGCDVGSLWTVDPLAQVLQCREVWHTSSIRATSFADACREWIFPSGIGLPGRVWATSAPTWISDVTSEDNFPRAQMAAAEGLHAAFACPIQVGTAFYGVIAFFSRAIKSPDSDLLEMMATIGQQIGQFIGRKQAEEAIRESEARYRSVTHAATDAIISADSLGNIISWNQGAHNIFGYEEDEVVGMPLTIIIPERYQKAHERGLQRLQQSGKSQVLGRPIELHGRRKDGTEFPIELSLAEWKVGERQFFSGVLRDATQRKLMEEQIRQAQKMEAIGNLAGGVAHDFNNLLTIIGGYGEIALNRLEGDSELREMIEQMVLAGERASALTRQLLAFSRKQILQSKVVDLNALIANMEKMLNRLIGENIEVKTSLPGGLGCVKADPGQLEQVVMNLAINARDAMIEGGKLTIATDSVRLHTSVGDLGAGFYITLSVSDTGCGMDRDTKGRLFEPFFTTKEPGKGTGLGLATVYGIVKQSGGHIKVDSELGSGSRFTVYLPCIEEPIVKNRSAPESELSSRGIETVLLVEDEESVRALTCRLLQQSGYHVLQAVNGADALEICTEFPGTIHLVVTDIVMPKLGGRKLADRLAILRPDTKVLFLSGYMDDAVLRQGILEAETDFLQKPFSPVDLGRKVREILDRRESPILRNGSQITSAFGQRLGAT